MTKPDLSETAAPAVGTPLDCGVMRREPTLLGVNLDGLDSELLVVVDYLRKALSTGTHISPDAFPNVETGLFYFLANAVLAQNDAVRH